MLTNHGSSARYLVLFIIWPFLAFIAGIVNFRQKEARDIVWLFLIYYGLTFMLNEYMYTDSLSYALRLRSNAELPFSEFFNIVGGIYSDTTVDIAEPLVSFIVSRITDFHGVYFAVWAALFGFFYLKSITLLYEEHIIKNNRNAYIFFLFFLFLIPITSINSVRMWTAGWIFFYGAYFVIIKKDPRFLFYTVGASFLHWSFIMANAVLIIYYLLGNRKIIYLTLAILSFIVPQLIAPIFGVLSERAGGLILDRYQGYTSTDYMQGIQGSFEQSAWFIRLGSDLLFYYLLLCIAVIGFRYFSNDDKEREDLNLFNFLLLFLAFVNFGSVIPSFGGRFMIIFFLFATVFVFRYFAKQPDQRYNLLSIAGIFPFLIFTLVQFRIGSDTINALLFAPGFGVPFLISNISLAEILFY